MQDVKNLFYRYKNLLFIIFVFFLGVTFAFLGVANLPVTTAAPVTDFNAGNIISDTVMSDYQSMTIAEIQAFLTAKNPCNNTDYDLYLDQSTRYPSYSWHWTGDADTGHFVCLSEELFGDGTEIGVGQTAAEIIYEAAQEYHINPQVLIVLLEKEQSLITDDFPNSRQYRSATGYGCPDTAACNSKYYGFKNQVNQAAWLFRYTLDNGYSAYPEKTTGVFVAYNPNSDCGRSEVYIENRATAALYRYTPYQPNAAALAAGRGVGDTCSAYGNRNFYIIFTEWFGDPRGVKLPAISIDSPIEPSDLGFRYSSHVQDVGWQEIAEAGRPVGSVGRGLRLEAYQIDHADVLYKSFVESSGWETTWRTNNEVSGTTGKAKKLSAVAIKLSDRLALNYDIYYRVRLSGQDWLGWAKNGEVAGIENSAYFIEAMQIVILNKGASAPVGPGSAIFTPVDTESDVDGETQVVLPEIEGISCHAHVQNVGWQSWVKNGATAGTTGKALRLEALEIRLVGEAADLYDIEYRAHVQNVGWQSWVKNGATAGTIGKALRLEAIEVRVVKK